MNNIDPDLMSLSQLQDEYREWMELKAKKEQEREYWKNLVETVDTIKPEERSDILSQIYKMKKRDVIPVDVKDYKEDNEDLIKVDAPYEQFKRDLIVQQTPSLTTGLDPNSYFYDKAKEIDEQFKNKEYLDSLYEPKKRQEERDLELKKRIDEKMTKEHPIVSGLMRTVLDPDDPSKISPTQPLSTLLHGVDTVTSRPARKFINWAVGGKSKDDIEAADIIETMKNKGIYVTPEQEKALTFAIDYGADLTNLIPVAGAALKGPKIVKALSNLSKAEGLSKLTNTAEKFASPVTNIFKKSPEQLESISRSEMLKAKDAENLKNAKEEEQALREGRTPISREEILKTLKGQY